MTFGIIYKVTNLVNGKIYIGQTVGILKYRKKNHFAKTKLIDKFPEKSHRKFHYALRKYGKDNFRWEKIDEALNREELDEKEIYWIRYFKSFTREHGYNILIGGQTHGKVDMEAVMQCVEKNLSVVDISKLLKYDTSTIYYRLRQYMGNEEYENYKKRVFTNLGKKISETYKEKGIKVENILKEIPNSKSMRDLAKKFNTSAGVVISKLKRFLGEDKYIDILKNMEKNKVVTKVKEKIKFILISPENKEFKLEYGLRKFCKEQELPVGKFHEILYNEEKENNYKGWKIYSNNVNSRHFYYANFT